MVEWFILQAVCLWTDKGPGQCAVLKRDKRYVYYLVKI